MAKKIICTILVIAMIAWVSLVLIDFLRVKENKEPKFCIKTETVKHSNSQKTEICTGLGYKVQNYYDDGKHTATEFGPFFIADRYASEKGE